MSNDRDDARPGHLRGAEERVRDHRRPDGGADPADLPLVRDLLARLLIRPLRPPQGNTVMQGSQDIAVHVGTLHLTAKAVIDAFRDDMHRATSSPSTTPTSAAPTSTTCASCARSSTMASSSAIAAVERPLGRHGGSVPGSFDVSAKDHFGEGVRIPPVRIWDEGVYRDDVVRLIVSNTRAPSDAEGDLPRQAEATGVAEREILRLVREVRRGDDRHRVRRGPGLRRAPDAQADLRAARTAPGRPRTTSTTTPPSPRASSRSRSS